MDCIALKPMMFSSFVFFLILLFITSHTRAKTCITSCGSNETEIRFPFWLNNSDPKSPDCGYPGFALRCNNRNQTILTLPNSGDFLVDHIDYYSQNVAIRDPNGCFLKRYLAGINTSHTPFWPLYVRSLYFLNCTISPRVERTCLTSRNHTIWATDSYTEALDFLRDNCSIIKELLTPVEYTIDFSRDALAWYEPYCRQCEIRGWCYRKGSSLKIGCHYYGKKGFSRGAKYCLIIGVGIPGLLLTLGLIRFVYWKITNDRQVGSGSNGAIETVPALATQRSAILTGLDELTIESYPKTQVDASRSLPNPNDNTCAICLNEYQPNETLRTIPECNHYFHVECIDEWLRINKTCPICRNLPKRSTLATPNSSLPSSVSIVSSES